MNGPGDRAAFEAAVDALKPRLHEDDLLFIHTNNHGDNFGSGSFLCTYPSFGEYFADDFAAKLGELPRYQSLIVMMEQCNSGGFNEPVIKFSTARATSVASAAIATQSSYASPDLHWDSFARDWFAAQTGHDPYGAALAFNPDTNGDGKIEATEAFNYANTVRNPQDSPNFNESSPAAGGSGWAVSTSSGGGGAGSCARFSSGPTPNSPKRSTTRGCTRSSPNCSSWPRRLTTSRPSCARR